jgi:hypothetical protein
VAGLNPRVISFGVFFSFVVLGALRLAPFDTVNIKYVKELSREFFKGLFFSSKETCRKVLGMPRANQKSDKMTVSVMLPRTMKKKLDELSILTKRTRSAYVELALEAQFKKDTAK